MGMADSGSDCDFGFAFNNVSFSDRLLRIEITRGGGDSGEVSCPSIVNRKRRREHVKNQSHELALATIQVESDLNNKSRESNCEENNNDRHEGEGSEDENECHYLGMTTTNPSLLRAKELHISSPILAAKSRFFYKLLSNGMLESEQKHFTLKIDASEEVAVMELLKFMYTNSLSATEVPALLHVLMAADKFEVASCFKYCSHLLLNVPMTLESALLILHLPSTLLMADPVKPLTNAARQFLTSRYKNITKYTQELMALPLVGLEAILASDDLMIASEDVVYDFVLRWAEKHYSVLEERQEILGSHLAPYIRFPHMTCQRLEQILDSDDFKQPLAFKLVLKALLFKAESLPQRPVLATNEYASLKALFVDKAESLPHRRAYRDRPIKIVEFEVPRRQCIVYLDLTRKECQALYPSSGIRSELFHLGGQGFLLLACCFKVPANLFQSFSLSLVMQEKGSVSQTVDFEFSARSKPTEDFDVKRKGSYNFDASNYANCRNFFATPWDRFIAKDSPYFINDVLHLRADLSIRL